MIGTPDRHSLPTKARANELPRALKGSLRSHQGLVITCAGVIT